MNYYTVVETTDEQWEIWEADNDENQDATCVGVFFDEELANSVVDLLNAEEALVVGNEEVEDLDDEDYGEAVDEFIVKNVYRKTEWNNDDQS